MGASGNPNATRLNSLSERKKALEDTLQKYNLELRQLCIKEAELTGTIPIEYPLEPGEKPPVFQKTGFQISQNLLNNLNGEENVSEMELELQLLAKMADAAQGMANDHNKGKTVRRHHRSEYEAIKKRYEALLEKIQFSVNSCSVAARQTASTSNKSNSQLKQKKKPRPATDEHVESSSCSSTGLLSITTDSTNTASSFSKESPHRRSSRSLASDRNNRDSVRNLVSTPLQRTESSDANIGGGGGGVSRGHTAINDLSISCASPSNHQEMHGGYAGGGYGDDMSQRSAQMNVGNGSRRAAYAHTIHAPRMVYEENQRQLDSLLYRQQALATQAQTMDRRHEHNAVVTQVSRPEHHSMYNINSSFPRQQMYEDPHLTQHHLQQQPQQSQHSAPVRPHSVFVYRQHQQLQPHQLYGDAQQHQQQQLLMQQQQQQQRLYWHTGSDSAPQQQKQQQQQQHLDMSSASAAVLDRSSSSTIITTPLRYGSLDRRRDRPQRTLQSNIQQQNHDIHRRKKTNITKNQSKSGNRLASTSSQKVVEPQQQYLHQQLQRTQSLGSVGVTPPQQQQLDTHSVDVATSDDVYLDTDLELHNITTGADDDSQSSCGSEQSMKYQKMRRHARSKEKSWYESSLDVQQDLSDRSSNVTNSSTHSVIAPEDKYGDIPLQLRQRATTISAANATMALNSLCAMDSPPALIRPLSTVSQHTHFSQEPECQQPGDRIIIHRPSPKQVQPQQKQQLHNQQPLIRPRVQLPQQVPPPPRLSVPHPQQLLEIPAESRPSPCITDRIQNHTMYEYTSPKQKAGTTVLQVGQCKPYQEETKPFEMSDYYKYSIKHNKVSPAKQQPQPQPQPQPSISIVSTLSPHLEFQRSSGQTNISAQRAINFSPVSPSKGTSSRVMPVLIQNSPRRSMNISFDMAPTQNIAENFATEMNQWYSNNNNRNNVNNNVILSDASSSMNGNSGREGNTTTTATLV